MTAPMENDDRSPDTPDRGEGSFPEEVPADHPLRALFRSATRRAFEAYKGLHEPMIESHIAEEILADFVHVDRVYKLKDAGGRRLTELAEMAFEGVLSSRSSGIERDLEVHQHAGDYALFMAGLFPESLKRRAARQEEPLLAYVGSILVAIEQPRDYYIVEGRSAYSRVSQLYRELDSERASGFHRLSHRFDEYLGLMGLIKTFLRSDPTFDKVEGIIS